MALSFARAARMLARSARSSDAELARTRDMSDTVAAGVDDGPPNGSPPAERVAKKPRTGTLFDFGWGERWDGVLAPAELRLASWRSKTAADCLKPLHAMTGSKRQQQAAAQVAVEEPAAAQPAAAPVTAPAAAPAAAPPEQNNDAPHGAAAAVQQQAGGEEEHADQDNTDVVEVLVTEGGDTGGVKSTGGKKSTGVSDAHVLGHWLKGYGWGLWPEKARSEAGHPIIGCSSCTQYSRCEAGQGKLKGKVDWRTGWELALIAPIAVLFCINEQKYREGKRPYFCRSKIKTFPTPGIEPGPPG